MNLGWKNIRRFAFEAAHALLPVLAAVVVWDVHLIAPGLA